MNKINLIEASLDFIHFLRDIHSPFLSYFEKVNATNEDGSEILINDTFYISKTEDGKFSLMYVVERHSFNRDEPPDIDEVEVGNFEKIQKCFLKIHEMLMEFALDSYNESIALNYHHSLEMKGQN